MIAGRGTSVLASLYYWIGPRDVGDCHELTPPLT